MHPGQVRQWKGMIRDRLPELFEVGGKPAEDSRKLAANLHRQIREHTVDLDYLKKSLPTWSFKRTAPTSADTERRRADMPQGRTARR